MSKKGVTDKDILKGKKGFWNRSEVREQDQASVKDFRVNYSY